MSFIVDLWRKQPGEWFCISAKRSSGAWHDRFFRRSEFNLVSDFVEERRCDDIYACAHGFSHDERQKCYAVMSRLLWADLDNVSPEDLDLEPTIAIRSSPGRYVGLWLTDEPVTEAMNKRLTYAVGADKSGWNLGKVLRLVPGTRNYKYEAQPKVKLLWDDGPEYRVHDLEHKLPQIEHKASGARTPDTIPPDVTAEDGKRLARKFGLGMMYLGPCGDRSKAVFKIVQRMALRGATAEEAYAVVMISRAAERFEGDRHRAWNDVLNIMKKKAA